MDDGIDTNLGPEINRLSALENNNSSSTRSGPSSASDHGAGVYGSGGGGSTPAVFAPS